MQQHMEEQAGPSPLPSSEVCPSQPSPLPVAGQQGPPQLAEAPPVMVSNDRFAALDRTPPKSNASTTAAAPRPSASSSPPTIATSTESRTALPASSSSGMLYRPPHVRAGSRQPRANLLDAGATTTWIPSASAVDQDTGAPPGAQTMGTASAPDVQPLGSSSPAPPPLRPAVDTANAIAVSSAKPKDSISSNAATAGVADRPHEPRGTSGGDTALPPAKATPTVTTDPPTFTTAAAIAHGEAARPKDCAAPASSLPLANPPAASSPTKETPSVRSPPHRFMEDTTGASGSTAEGEASPGRTTPSTTLASPSPSLLPGNARATAAVVDEGEAPAVKLSRTVKRKRKMRATAELLAQAETVHEGDAGAAGKEANFGVVSAGRRTSSRETPEVVSSRSHSKPTAQPPNTSSVSRRPGWHPPMAVSGSSMVSPQEEMHSSITDTNVVPHVSTSSTNRSSQMPATSGAAIMPLMPDPSPPSHYGLPVNAASMVTIPGNPHLYGSCPTPPHPSASSTSTAFVGGGNATYMKGYAFPQPQQMPLPYQHPIAPPYANLTPQQQPQQPMVPFNYYKSAPVAPPLQQLQRPQHPSELVSLSASDSGSGAVGHLNSQNGSPYAMQATAAPVLAPGAAATMFDPAAGGARGLGGAAVLPTSQRSPALHRGRGAAAAAKAQAQAAAAATAFSLNVAVTGGPSRPSTSATEWASPMPVFLPSGGHASPTRGAGLPSSSTAVDSFPASLTTMEAWAPRDGSGGGGGVGAMAVTGSDSNPDGHLFGGALRHPHPQDFSFVLPSSSPVMAPSPQRLRYPRHTAPTGENGTFEGSKAEVELPGPHQFTHGVMEGLIPTAHSATQTLGTAWCGTGGLAQAASPPYKNKALNRTHSRGSNGMGGGDRDGEGGDGGAGSYSRIPRGGSGGHLSPQQQQQQPQSCVSSPAFAPNYTAGPTTAQGPQPSTGPVLTTTSHHHQPNHINGSHSAGGGPSYGGSHHSRPLTTAPPIPYYDFITVLPTFVSTCLTLQPEDEAHRERLCWIIEAVLRKNLSQDAEIRVHGSITTGLALPCSDVDLLAVGYQPFTPLEALQRLSQALLELDEKGREEALLFQEIIEAEAHHRRRQLLEEEKERGRQIALVKVATPAPTIGDTPGGGDLDRKGDSRRRRGIAAGEDDDEGDDKDVGTGTDGATAADTRRSRTRKERSGSNDQTLGVASKAAAVTLEDDGAGDTASDYSAEHAPTAEHTIVRSAGEKHSRVSSSSDSTTSTVFPLDSRKVFLTAHPTADEVDDLLPTVSGTVSFLGSGGEASPGGTERVPAAHGRDADLVRVESTEVYGTVDEVELAEEVFRGQIEKDYRFSTTLDVSKLFAPVIVPLSSVPARPVCSGGVAGMPATSSSTSSAAVGLAPSQAPGECLDVTVNDGMPVQDFPSFAGTSGPLLSTSAATSGEAVLAQPQPAAHGHGHEKSDPVLSPQRPTSTGGGGGDAAAAAEHEDVREERINSASKVVGTPEGGSHTEDAAAGEDPTQPAAASAKLASTTIAAERAVAADVSSAAMAGMTQRSSATVTAGAHDHGKRTAVAPFGHEGGAGHLNWVPTLEGPLFLVQSITGTRVPVLKLTDKATGTKVDITFAGGEHWRSMQLTRSLLEVFPQARPIILFLKYCVRSLGIGEGQPGGVTSFSIYLMVRHFYNECRKRILAILQEWDAHTRHPQGTTVDVAAEASEADAASAGTAEGVKTSTILEEHAVEGIARSGTGDPVAKVSTPRLPSASPNTSSATAGLDLTLLEHMLGEYLLRVEQRHAQMAAEAGATERMSAPADAAHGNKVASSSPAESSTEAAAAITQQRGACATIKAAYANENTSSLLTICEAILGFVGDPTSNASVLLSEAHTSATRPLDQGEASTDQAHHHRKLSVSLSEAVAASRPNSPRASRYALERQSREGSGASADDVQATADGAAARLAPSLHHYMLKTVEPQPYERVGVEVVADEDTSSREAGENGAHEPKQATGSCTDGSTSLKATEKEKDAVAMVEENEEKKEGPQQHPRESLLGLSLGDQRAAEDVSGAPSLELVSKGGDEHRGQGEDTVTAEKDTEDDVGRFSLPLSETGTADTVSAEVEREANSTNGSACVGPDGPGEAMKRCSSNSTPAPAEAPTPISDEAAFEAFAVDFLRKVTVPDLFLDFCHYYGRAFDYEANGIHFGLDGSSIVVEKPYHCSRRGQHFHLTSPFDPEYDLTARMTHMRDFQWLCLSFAEWGAARQSPSYYGSCSLQYVLQCFSPMTAEEDCQAVHQALMKQAVAAAKSAESAAVLHSGIPFGGGGGGVATGVIEEVPSPPRPSPLPFFQGQSRSSRISAPTAHPYAAQPMSGPSQPLMTGNVNMCGGQAWPSTSSLAPSQQGLSQRTKMGTAPPRQSLLASQVPLQGWPDNAVATNAPAGTSSSKGGTDFGGGTGAAAVPQGTSTVGAPPAMRASLPETPVDTYPQLQPISLSRDGTSMPLPFHAGGSSGAGSGVEEDGLRVTCRRRRSHSASIELPGRSSGGRRRASGAPGSEAAGEAGETGGQRNACSASRPAMRSLPTESHQDGPNSPERHSVVVADDAAGRAKEEAAAPVEGLSTAVEKAVLSGPRREGPDVAWTNRLTATLNTHDGSSLHDMVDPVLIRSEEDGDDVSDGAAEQEDDTLGESSGSSAPRRRSGRSPENRNNVPSQYEGAEAAAHGAAHRTRMTLLSGDADRESHSERLPGAAAYDGKGTGYHPSMRGLPFSGSPHQQKQQQRHHQNPPQTSPLMTQPYPNLLFANQNVFYAAQQQQQQQAAAAFYHHAFALQQQQQQQQRPHQATFDRFFNQPMALPLHPLLPQQQQGMMYPMAVPLSPQPTMFGNFGGGGASPSGPPASSPYPFPYLYHDVQQHLWQQQQHRHQQQQQQQHASLSALEVIHGSSGGVAHGPRPSFEQDTEGSYRSDCTSTTTGTNASAPQQQQHPSYASYPRHSGGAVAGNGDAA